MSAAPSPAPVRDTDVAAVAALWHHLEGADPLAGLVRLAPGVVWRQLETGEVLRGGLAVARHFHRLRHEGVELRGRAYAIERFGDCVLVHGTVRYSGRGTLREAQGWWVHRVEDGLVVAIAGYTGAADAHAAAGLPA